MLARDSEVIMMAFQPGTVNGKPINISFGEPQLAVSSFGSHEPNEVIGGVW